MFRNLRLTTALALLVASPAGAQSYLLRDLSVQPATTPAAPAQPAALGAEAWFDRANATYALGESVGIFVRANADAYVTALSIGPTGAVTQIFPNAFNPNNFVRAYAAIQIPGPGALARVGGSLGSERVKIIVTNRPVQIVPESQLAAAGPFRTVTGGADTLVRDLQTLADPTWPGSNMVILDRTFRSVAPAGSAIGSGVIVVVPGPAAPASTIFYPLPATGTSPSASLERPAA